MNIQVGNIVTIKSESTRYRIVALLSDSVVLCMLDTTKFVLVELSKISLLNMLHEKSIVFIEEANENVLDIETLPEVAKARFLMKQETFNVILRIYGPSFMGLCGKSSKDDLYNILEKNSYSKSAFWRDCVKFFQSGFNYNTLIDSKYLGTNKGKTYSFLSKPGRKGIYFETG